jgi:hypothetical protein
LRRHLEKKPKHVPTSGKNAFEYISGGVEFRRFPRAMVRRI